MNELNQFGILSGNEIRQRMSKGDIVIELFDPAQLVDTGLMDIWEGYMEND